MAYFTREFSSFFKDLSKKNDTEWFNENRKRYEAHVKKPFAEFVNDVIGKVQKLDPSVKIKPADAIMRINKDIRFSKDKTPYNTHVGAVISPAGKKDKSVPGLYIQPSADRLTMFGGAYVLDPAQLKKVRSKIAANPGAFAKLYQDKTFRSLFGGIKGEQSKRLDVEWQDVAKNEPMIANKQFYFQTELNGKEITSDQLMDTILSHYKAAQPLNRFLQEALAGRK